MEETINISELNSQAPQIVKRTDPDRNRLDLSGIINNTSIEDRILADPELSRNGSVLQNIQTAADLTNRSNILEQRLLTASEDLSSAVGGRVFAGPGQRNALAQRRNLIDAERREVVAALEEVRGNVSTASSLRSEANRLKSATANSSSVTIDDLVDADLTTQLTESEEATGEVIDVATQQKYNENAENNRIKKIKIIDAVKAVAPAMAQNLTGLPLREVKAIVESTPRLLNALGASSSRQTQQVEKQPEELEASEVLIKGLL